MLPRLAGESLLPQTPELLGLQVMALHLAPIVGHLEFFQSFAFINRAELMLGHKFLFLVIESKK